MINAVVPDECVGCVHAGKDCGNVADKALADYRAKREEMGI